MSVRRRRALGILLALCLQAPAGLGADQPAAAPAPEPSAETPTYELLCGEALTIWRKVRDPAARDCCAFVVRARAGLWSARGRARALAERAQHSCPLGIEAAVSVAAAELAEGDSALSHRLFERASTGKNAAAFARLAVTDQLLAARAANLAGERGRALDHYRAVILELDRVPSPHERARVLLEAALLASRATPPEEAEALAYLRQSADQLSPRLSAVRLLVGRAIEPELAGDADASHELALAREVVSWMQGSAPPARGAPGELLPVLSADLLAELLPAPPQLDVEEP